MEGQLVRETFTTMAGGVSKISGVSGFPQAGIKRISINIKRYFFIIIPFHQVAMR
jgi:hypothetical protein